MAYIDDLHQALIKADAAGNAEDAKALADEIRAQSQPKKEGYSNLAEKVLKGPAKAGFMNLAAGLAGLPVDTAQNVYNLAKAGVGVATGRPQDFPLVEGTPGGSQFIRELMGRSPYTSTENPNPESPGGTAAYDIASRGVGVPGMTLSGLAAYLTGKTAGPQYEPLAALVPAAARQALNEISQPAREAARTRNIERDQTLKAAQQEGYKVVPSSVNPSFAENRVESLAGKAALKQQLSIDNANVTYNIARREAGIPENQPVNPDTLAKAREIAAEPYRQIAAVSPVASQALDGLKQARFMSQKYWSFFDRSGDPAAMLKAKDLENRANLFERVIQKEASRHGMPGLVQDLKEARVELAKNYAVERAYNPGDGSIDARVIARAYHTGWTGGLETIAKFAMGPGRQVTRPSSAVPTPGVSALEPVAAGLFGLGGKASGMGLWPAGLPILGPMTRAGVASGPYQKFAATPNYSPLNVNSIPAVLQASMLANQGTVPLSGILNRPTQDSMVPLSDLARH